MNIREINKWSSSAVVVLTLLLGGCAKEPIETNGDPSTDSEGVAVSLTLLPRAVQSPSGGVGIMAYPSVKSAASNTGMDLQLIDEPATRAVDDAAVVNNVWIMQFNGSGDGALLASKQYLPASSASEIINLKPGVNQRIVVLANSDDAKLADALTTTTTWAKMKKLARPIAHAMEGAVPMSGSVVTTIVKDGVYPIPLTRTFAKVTLRIKLGKGMATTGWQIQPTNFPPGYWFPETSGNFPLASEVTETYMVADVGITLSTTEYREFSYYLPVNQRGMVAGATAQNRRTSAPPKSTYIKVFRSAPNGSTLVRTNYYFYVGGNLTDDYNLRANTHYTFQAILYANAGSDSRVERADVDISGMKSIGMFGGRLEGRNGVWQYTKELWVQTAGVISLSWASVNVQTGAVDLINGKKNTAKMVALGGHDSADNCYQKSPSGEWYLPAVYQLQGFYIVKNLFPGIGGGRYWCSFEVHTASSIYVDIGTGNTGYNNNNNKGARLPIRCTREL